MNRDLYEILERIYFEGQFGECDTFDEWLHEEEGCEGRAEYITKLIKDAVKD